MSVIVKGMEMPETCMRCDFLRFYNVYCCGRLLKNIYSGKRRDDCPLVEVPPHGKLIDADALKAWFVERYDLNADLEIIHFLEILSDEDSAPTIIEAEEET